MVRRKLNINALAAMLALLSFPLACGAETPNASAKSRVAGEKLDSGLGELPHYREWAHHPVTRWWAAAADAARVPGEKLDSGLGELPHYREWARHPATRLSVAAPVADGAGGVSLGLADRR